MKSRALPARDSIRSLGLAVSAGLSLLTLMSVAPGAARPTNPPEPIRSLDVLIVLYTRSFAQTLTREQVERVHEEVFEFIDFYRTAVGDAVEFRISYLQIDRELTRAEVSEVAPGRYYLAREDIEDELVALGMRERGFDEVIALYAWNNANPDGAVLAYGGGAVGPDGNFLGDAGYNSIGVFAWDPGRISQIMIHEVLHNIDDMFSMSGMPDGFLNSDEMSRNMSTLLAERPGAFRPHYTDDEMVSYAERELANRATYPWAMQLVYYGWMLRRTPREKWLALDYGRNVEPRPDAGPRPLYERVFVSDANRIVYFPVANGDAETAVRIAGTADTRLPVRTYRHTDFDGRALFEGDYNADWLRIPTEARALTVTVGGRTAEIIRLGAGDLGAPARIVAYGAAAQGGGGDDEGTLEVEVRRARLGGGGPLVPGATVDAVLGGDTLRLEETEPGRHRLGLTRLALGSHRLTLNARAAGLVFAPRPLPVQKRLPWSIEAEGERVVGNGAPFDLTLRIAEDAGVRGARVTARVAGREVVLREGVDGVYSVVLEEGLGPGLDTVHVRAELPGGGGDVLERSLPVYVEPRGWIEVPPRVGAAAGTTASVEARVRDRMGRVVIGARLPLAIVVGSELLLMSERTDGSGVYDAQVVLPPGEHRLYVIGLEGRFERRVVVVQVE